MLSQERNLLCTTQRIGERELTLEEKRALMGIQVAADSRCEKNPVVKFCIDIHAHQL